MPRARVGSLAFRYRGTSVGFRVRSDSEVVGVKEFVQVRNAEGQVSNWLPADDFILTPRNERRLKIYWLVLYKTTADGPVLTSCCESYGLAQATLTGVRNNGFILVATKKITLEIDQ